MKKFLAIPLLALGLSSVSSATTITNFCGPLQQLIVDGNAPVAGSNTCSAFDAGAGNIITDVSLILAFDAQFVLIAPTHLTITFTPDGPAAAFGATSVDLTGSVLFGALTSTPSSPYTVSFTLNPNTQTFGAFNTAITAVMHSGNVDSSSARVLVQYVTAPDTAPPAEVPEPTTFVLLGSTLTGLGLVARRRA